MHGRIIEREKVNLLQVFADDLIYIFESRFHVWDYPQLKGFLEYFKNFKTFKLNFKKFKNF